MLVSTVGITEAMATERRERHKARKVNLAIMVLAVGEELGYLSRLDVGMCLGSCEKVW